MAENNVKVVTLKLLINSSVSKILFSEAGKDFVDFLFQILSLPVETVVKLLNVRKMVGSLGDLYKSISALDTDYLEPHFDIDSLMKPSASLNVPLFSLNVIGTPTTPKLEKCLCSIKKLKTGVHSPSCRYVNDEDTKKATNSSSVIMGCVKGVVTYMVMDNLEVKPMSTISGITLINKFCVKDIASLAETEVQVGLKEGLAILKASLQTKDVLTTVLLRKMF